ncbi:RDD family protein [Actinomadura terrae]|uniref:RDD family protein n=1 Tax=Actinomadura terrae TaxID=604353 RepID=UPI001FA769AE|nr:RDD family protein [Actinomadura terrae]
MYGPPPPPPPPPPFAGPPPPPVPYARPPEAEPEPSDTPPRRRRLGAWAIDAAVMMGAAVLLGMMTWGRLHGLLVEGLWSRALGAIGGLVLSGGDVQEAAEDFGVGVWNSIVADIEQALLLLVLIEVLYQFAAQAFAGRTLGKAALDLRVTSGAGRPAKARALRRALVTTAGSTGLYCTAWFLLLEGMFFLAVLVWLAALAVFAANSLPALVGARRRTLADLAAGTAVVRARSYRRAAELAVQGAGIAWDGTQAAGQVAGRAVRENAARVAQTESVRRALDSERARQVQDMGKRVGGRLNDAYQQRRDARRAPAIPAADQPAALPASEPHYDPYGVYGGQGAQNGQGAQSGGQGVQSGQGAYGAYGVPADPYAPPPPYIPPPRPRDSEPN